jgi:hypothetical protein
MNIFFYFDDFLRDFRENYAAVKCPGSEDFEVNVRCCKGYFFMMKLFSILNIQNENIGQYFLY